VPVTRGWLDTRYAGAWPRPSRATARACAHRGRQADGLDLHQGPPDRPGRADASLEWTAPKPYDGAPTPTFDLELGPATSLTLPLVGAGDLRTLFAR
jgi:hypothetical protein